MGEDFTILNSIIDVIKFWVSDAFFDTLQIVPFLLVTYVILEYMEHHMSTTAIKKIQKAGPFGPIIGAALGIIPQCGFSSAASTFYSGRVITLGTLFAVYLSTSDEMIPLFIAGGLPASTLIILIVTKFILGLVFGYIIDAFIKAFKLSKTSTTEERFEIHKLCERDQCSCNNKDSKSHGKIFRPAVLHTLQVSIFIFIITVILNIILQFAGGYDSIANFVQANKFTSVFVASLIGLVPSCASSVVLSKLYIDGLLGIGALLGGLLVTTGVGILILIRNNRPMKQNLIIILMIYAIGAFCGLIVTLIMG